MEDLTNGNQFYDGGKPFDNEKFDKAEDGHLKKLTKPPKKPFNMPDFGNALMAGYAKLLGEV